MVLPHSRAALQGIVALDVPKSSSLSSIKNEFDIIRFANTELVVKLSRFSVSIAPSSCSVLYSAYETRSVL